WAVPGELAQTPGAGRQDRRAHGRGRPPPGDGRPARARRRRAGTHGYRPPGAEPGRRVPHPHRPPGRRGDRRRSGLMTAAVASVGTGAPAPTVRRPKWQWAILDGLAVTERNLIAYTRIPEALFFSSVQPLMFVLLFRYVFGGAIKVPGVSYVNYLIPGIFVQTVSFGAVGTSIGLAEDLHKGIIERFRALPMARPAVL